MNGTQSDKNQISLNNSFDLNNISKGCMKHYSRGFPSPYEWIFTCLGKIQLEKRKWLHLSMTRAPGSQDPTYWFDFHYVQKVRDKLNQ